MTRIFILALLALVINACAFIPHNDERPYPYTASTPTAKKNIRFKVLSSSKRDNIIGKIRNNWGAETADITIPESRTVVVQKAVENELISQGYQLDTKANDALVIRVNQLEIELAQERGGVGYFGICDLNVYLKTKEGLFERNVVANDEVFSLLAVTAASGVDVFYRATQNCAKQIATLVGEKSL